MSVDRTREENTEAPPVGRVESILPLRLTAFENYMFVDDRPSHPMVFVIEIEVSGDLRVEPLKESITMALKRHPLLTARISRRPLGKCWVHAKRGPVVETVPDGATDQIKRPYIKLRRTAGLRIWIAPNAEGGKIHFAFHHATTDGLGAMEFIGDVLVNYAHLTAEPGEELPELRPIDVSVLKERSCIDNPAGGPGPTRLGRAITFFRDMGRSASRLAPPPQAPSAGHSLRMLPPFVSRTLNRDDLGGLKLAAARRMLHVNDLYVAAIYKSIYDWNRQYGEPDDGRVIRMSLPASLRTPRHDLSPAANIVNMVFFNRKESECGSLDALLDRAGELTNASTHDRLFFRVMQWARFMPGVMELSTRVPYSFATMVLSNVGDVKRQFGTRFPMSRGRCVAGSVTIESLRGTPPLRPGTNVSISLGTYAGNLLINAICDPHLFSRDDADRFLDLFISQLNAMSASDAVRRAA